MQTREERDLAEEDNDFGDVFKSDNDVIGLRNIVADIAKYSDIRKANTDLTTDGRLIPEKDLVNYNEYLLNNNGPNATTASKLEQLLVHEEFHKAFYTGNLPMNAFG